MSDDVLLRVQGVSKKYCRDLKRSLWFGVKDAAADLLGRGEGIAGLRRDEFWAVDDVSFELKRGECLGLIGRNGAGKTTLLKMLNGLVKPDKGRIEMRGRVGALIALGAGFNPILTGRENIYINGAVLGLSKREIDAKIDGIINFAEIGDFIDAPVQSYSSGMAVRLGFAVASHINPDVLLIDEVLAVGDAGFRAKCYNIIVALLDRSAIIFVSHSMPSIHRVATRALVLTSGAVVFEGDVASGIEKYDRLFDDGNHVSKDVLGTGEAIIHEVNFLNDKGVSVNESEHGHPFQIRLDMSVASIYPEYNISLTFIDSSNHMAAQYHSRYNGHAFQNTGKRHIVQISFNEQLLNPGKYFVDIVIYGQHSLHHLCWRPKLFSFYVRGSFVGSAPVQLLATINKTVMR